MIPTLETAVFFLAITALLGFSNWAEGWLASSSRSAKERPPGTTSLRVGELSQPGTAHEAIRAA
jgi:hypothetical protein